MYMVFHQNNPRVSDKVVCSSDANLAISTLVFSFALNLRQVLFVYLFVEFRPTQEFFTHLEMSPLPVKDCKFWPKLGTHSHWAVRVLERAKPAVTRVNRLKWSLARTSETCCRTFGSGAVTACFNDLGLSRLGIEHRSPACEVNDLPLRHVLDPRGFF